MPKNDNLPPYCAYYNETVYLHPGEATLFTVCFPMDQWLDTYYVADWHVKEYYGTDTLDWISFRNETVN